MFGFRPSNSKSLKEQIEETNRQTKLYRLSEGRRLLKEACDELYPKDLVGDVLASVRLYSGKWKVGTIYSFEVEELTEQVNSVTLNDVIELNYEIYVNSIPQMIKEYEKLKARAIPSIEIKADEIYGITYQTKIGK